MQTVDAAAQKDPVSVACPICWSPARLQRVAKPDAAYVLIDCDECRCRSLRIHAKALEALAELSSLKGTYLRIEGHFGAPCRPARLPS
jgi:hypothetical protein